MSENKEAKCWGNQLILGNLKLFQVSTTLNFDTKLVFLDFQKHQPIQVRVYWISVCMANNEINLKIFWKLLGKLFCWSLVKVGNGYEMPISPYFITKENWMMMNWKTEAFGLVWLTMELSDAWVGGFGCVACMHNLLLIPELCIILFANLLLLALFPNPFFGVDSWVRIGFVYWQYGCNKVTAASLVHFATKLPKLKQPNLCIAI